MKRITFEESAICPLANSCEATIDKAAPCGSLPDHLPPLVIAEDLCQRALTGRTRLERLSGQDEPRTRESEVREDSRNLNLAWLRLERAMSRKVETSGAEDCFDDAEAYAFRVINSSTVDFRSFQSAALLIGHAPAFRGRRFETGLDEEESQAITQATAWLGRVAQQAPVHTSNMHADHFPWPDHQPCFESEMEREDFLKKLGSMLLAMHTGEEVYPGSNREAVIAQGEVALVRTDYAHDYYILQYPLKLPINAQGARHKGRWSGASVVSVSYDDLVSAISGRWLKMRPGYELSRFRMDTVSWLIQEGFGRPLKETQKEDIEFMSEILIKQIRRFSARFTD
jgi:hypothetical protein